MLSIPKYPEQYAQHFPTIFYLLCCASQHHVLYIVIKVASYRGFERIRVGSDSNIARSQINALRASVHADSQQRILRRLFWLRCWSTVSVESFRVPSFLNAADPLSRETGFHSRKQAIAEAARRREMWDAVRGIVHLS